MTDIQILPIFDQSAPGIWDDMLRIRVATMKHNYGVVMSPLDISQAYTDYANAWQTNTKNFAFAAYDDTKMIASIHGDCEDCAISMRHLYVLPEYQHMGLGRRLMSAMENACAFDADMIDLVALYPAVPFYKSIGYTSPTHDNYLVKDISLYNGVQVSPLFWTNSSTSKRCASISRRHHGRFDSANITQHHLPTYVYRASDGMITGVAGPDDKSVYADSSYIAKYLSHALTQFTAHQIKTQQTNHR